MNPGLVEMQALSHDPGPARFEVLDPTQWPEWDAFLPALPESRLRQTSVYSAALRLHGYRPEIVVLREGERILAGALLGFKPIPLLGGSISQTTGGMAIAPGLAEEVITLFIEELAAHARRSGAVRLKIEWRRPHSIRGQVLTSGESERGLLQRLGVLALTFDGTYYVRLREQSSESLFQRLDTKARQHIRRCQREGLRVEVDSSADALREFDRCYEAMSSRKSIDGMAAGFRDQTLRPALDRGMARLYVARLGARTLNHAFVGLVGNPLYEWGAVAPPEENPGAPSTVEFLHFEIMRHLMSEGRAIYDLGGSPGPDPVAGHPNYTVWRFKKRLGGDYVYFVGEGHRVLRPLADRIVGLALARRRSF